MSPTQKHQSPRLQLDDFIAEEELACLLECGEVARAGWLLTARDGRIWALQEAVRVLGSTSHETDPYGLCGAVDSLGSMIKRGFVMSAERIALGRCVYDVEYGYIAQPINGADTSGVNPRME